MDSKKEIQEIIEEGEQINNEVKNKENIMGKLPVNKLLVKMAMPLIFSLLVQALYSIVDSIYVSKLGESALTAISLSMTPQYLIMAVGTGIGVGVNALLSSRLGKKDMDGVNRSVGNGIVLDWLCGILFVLVGLFLIPPFFQIMTDVISIQEMAVDYGSVICLFAICSFQQILMERVLIATGRAQGAMVSMIVGSVINIILDPILIWGYFGFPEMGIAGAAYATVISQGVAAIVSFVLNLYWNKDVSFKTSMLHLEKNTVKKIVETSIPVALSLSIIAVLAFGVNGALLRVSTVAPAIYVIYIRLQSFVLMPADGMRDAGIAIIAYNYSRKSKTRIIETVKKSMIAHLFCAIIGIVLFWGVPHILLQIFDASSDMIKVGVPALRIISIAFPLTGGTHIIAGYLQALGHSDKTFIVSIIQAITLIGGAWLLSFTGSVNLVWLAFPIVEIIIFAISSIFAYRVYNQKLRIL